MMRVPTLSLTLALGAAGFIAWSWVAVPEDPRGAESVSRYVRDREARSFRERLRSGAKEDWAWPGLRSAQISWTWLELLQGVHEAASYEGDFSWMFSKLHTVAQYSSPKELQYLTMLAPFYFVMGKDHAGATFFLDELIRRAPQSYNVWFWGGFHAVDNLFHNKMAAYCYEQAALKPGAPDYLAALALRLKFGRQAFSNESERKAILSGNISPELLERIARARPEWFRDQ